MQIAPGDSRALTSGPPSPRPRGRQFAGPRLRRVTWSAGPRQRGTRPARPARPARQRLPALLPALLAVWALAAGVSPPAAAGSRPPSRLRLQRLAAPLTPGQTAQLVIETVGEHGEALAALRPLAVTLVGATGLTATTRVTVETGASKVAVPVSARKPGLWQIDARAEGLYSASMVVSCVEPDVLQRHQALASVPVRGTAAAPVPKRSPPPRPPPPPPPGAASRAPAPATAGGAAATAAAGATGTPRAQTEEERLRAGGPPHAAPPKSAKRSFASRLAASAAPGAAAPGAVAPGAAAPGAVAPGAVAPVAPAPGAAATATPGAAGAGATAPAAAAAAGEVRLIPEPLERYRGSQGWDSVAVDAYWFENGNPRPAPHQVDLNLVANAGDLQIDPVWLHILAGDFKTKESAKVTALAAAKASLQALYDGGLSNLVDVSFLAAPAAKLSFSSGPQRIPAFGVVSSEVYVRLLDAAGVPALAEQPIQVTLQLSGPIGSPPLPPAQIKPGDFETSALLQLPRFGAYTVAASAPGLLDAEPLSIEVAFDWLLLLATLAGGLLGSLTRLLYRGQAGEGTRRLLRVLLLGGLAALLVVLLSAFGLLSLLTGALPQGWSDALAKVPLGSLTGVFLLGFLAGLLFDRIFGGLVSRPAAAEPGGAPPPPAAPSAKP
jgi:hypothetical protein